MEPLLRMIVIQPSYTDRAGNMMGGRSQPGQGPSRSSPSSGSEGKSEHWKHLVEVSWREERGERRGRVREEGVRRLEERSRERREWRWEKEDGWREERALEERSRWRR